ncbi:helix-turn-helix domain-containing protein [Microvirga brassicacearum]|uniref:Helix-turn-helix domain-containing protein n=1 Tax=Microvirga brassicacearum TaxID=2580413 RepID=A0A5N3P5K4_9HYPH|nr:XRE family transcriptional regulator [Microvirga brassicacearum]KAB0265027.1 helix-turn-helix domain-containing protein [Microvirga brassicacearum]
MKVSTKPALIEPKRVRRDTGFGSRIKQLRLERGLTLQQLGKRCELAASTISKVEQNHISPTYENVLRLADGLHVDVAELFSPKPNRMMFGRRSVTRAGHGAKLRSAQYDYEMLCADLSSKQFIPLLTTLSAHSIQEFPNYISHEGEEFIYVMSGVVELHTDIYEPLRLQKGDSCYFDSTMGHACLSVGDQDAVILWVCSRVTLSPADEAQDAVRKQGDAEAGPLLVTEFERRPASPGGHVFTRRRNVV